MDHKIIVEEDLTLEQLEKQVSLGGRFILYQYTFTILFAITLTRFSPAIFIPNGKDGSKYKKKYNRISRIFGWPGIFSTMRALKVNKKGGIDVTDDIMLNLDSEGLLQRKVNMVEIAEIFIHVDKSDSKVFNETIKKDFEFHSNIKEIFVGLFINTEEYVEPHLVIGIRAKNDFEEATVDVDKSLRKQYRKVIFFEYIDLNEMDELSTDLRAQGEKFV